MVEEVEKDHVPKEVEECYVIRSDYLNVFNSVMKYHFVLRYPDV